MAKHMTIDARKGMAHGLECRINAESVVPDPILLGGRFKKEANRAILHRHGAL